MVDPYSTSAPHLLSGSFGGAAGVKGVMRLVLISQCPELKEIVPDPSEMSPLRRAAASSAPVSGS